MPLVLDVSATIPWFIDDEAQPELDDILLRVRAEGAVVPGLWPLEVANALQVAVRRRRLALAGRDAALAVLLELLIVVDDETAMHAWTTTLTLADRHRLTTYDAAYLELARRRRLPLASLDADLRAAAAAEGVSILPA